MADNVTMNAGDGLGSVVRTDDDGTAHWQYVKLAYGADDTQTIVTSTATNPLPVALSDTDNAVLDAIVTATEATQTAVEAIETAQLADGHNVVVTSAPTTAVTHSALTELGASINASKVDVNITQADATVPVSNTGLTALFGAIAGSEMQVDIVTAPTITVNGHAVTAANDNSFNATIGDGTRTATVRDTGASDSLNVAITDGSGGQITSFGGGTQYAIDTAAGGTDTGTVSLAIRDDALTTLTPIDGDYVPLRVNSTGALHVTGAGGGTQYSVDDAAPTVVTMAGAVRDDTLTTLTEVDGDATLLRVSSTGALHVTGGGAGTEYTEDESSPATIVGTATMMERDDVLGSLTPIEGDWASFRCSAEGALWTQDFNSDAILSDTTDILADTAAIDTATAASAASLVDIETNTDFGASKGAGTAAGVLRTTLASDDPGVAHLATIAGAVSTQMQVDIVADGAGLATEATLATIDADTSNIATNTTGLGAAIASDGGGDVANCVIVGGIDGSNSRSLVCDANGNLQVDVVTNALASGSATAANQIARASGGTEFHTNAGVSTLTQISAAASTLYWLHAINLKASVLFLQVFNLASASVTLGTTVADMVFPLPTQGDTNGAGFTLAISHGIALDTGLSYAITTTATGNTAASSGEAYLNTGYYS